MTDHDSGQKPARIAPVPIDRPIRCFFATRALARAGIVLALAACGPLPNDPHPIGERGQNILYSAFMERPRHLDPVQSFVEDEATFLYQIVEPPLQYHYLKRPYALEPAVAARMPQVRYFAADGRELPDAADPSLVARSVIDIRIRPGVRYAPHPAFALDAHGKPRYAALTEADLADIRRPADFPEQGSRELLARDFVYQIKRLAHPRLHSPILELMSEYLPGLKNLHGALSAHIAAHPDEWPDLDAFPLDGVEVLDDYTYRITLKGLYPQFLYWLSMPFFGPIPREVDRFFSQPGMVSRNLTLDAWPMGTGPYMLVENNPNARMTMARNPHYRHDTYPCEGAPGDAEAGLLEDCGKALPFIDKIVFSREREAIPYWNKFLQGYYDAAGISSDNFDQAVNLGSQGEVTLSDDMSARGIRLATSISPSIFYLGFNMRDPLVGAGNADAATREHARLLRQAISVALDVEEYISIFLNGRGIPAMQPIPPGIFGAHEGEAGINPVIYTWQDGKPRRRGLDDAKRLLAAAGWPDGRNARTGEPLLINFDTTATGMGDKAVVDWLAKQFRALGVQFNVRTTDWNRFQEKILQGNAQIFFMGWNADYPDPENLLFLLHGPQGKADGQGNNAANYRNAEYDRLFERMKILPDGPERQTVIDRMTDILRHDAPWVFWHHPKAYSLQHGWLYNRKPGNIVRNTLKYQRLDPAAREAARLQWNRPTRWPLAATAALLLLFIFPALRFWRRHERATATPDSKETP
ncbi:MAG: ABC transporter substrate-binding protein [Azoarcus sp.]|jgi:ABC-type transport system substrate-binding protein|nr:ABC transporter substrate-binding protein [Azoarcus sp.]